MAKLQNALERKSLFFPSYLCFFDKTYTRVPRIPVLLFLHLEVTFSSILMYSFLIRHHYCKSTKLATFQVLTKFHHGRVGILLYIPLYLLLYFVQVIELVPQDSQYPGNLMKDWPVMEVDTNQHHPQEIQSVSVMASTHEDPVWNL